MFNLNGLLLVLFFIIISESFATISKSDKKKKATSQQANNLNIYNIYDNIDINVKKDIIEKGLTYSDELKDIKNFNGNTLAYVTPWNNYGYDIAKIFAAKFSLVSPVWLRISYDGHDFQISGSRDIDVKWIMELKSKNPKMKVVPRLLFENWSRENFKKMMKNEYLISKCIDLISQFLSKYNFDGVVMEMWLQIGAYFKSDSYHFLTHFGQDMKHKNLLNILAIPPPVYNGNYEGLFDRNDYQELVKSVDFFSLMTYDYSNSQTPGPNAPLHWMSKCVNILEPNNDKFARSRILLGLNFYGYQYSYTDIRAIIRHEFIDILKKAGNIETVWHKDSKEHEFRIKNLDGQVTSVWYPTVEFLDLRIKLAESLGVGISIWEIGQGLDYFYNIL